MYRLLPILLIFSQTISLAFTVDTSKYKSIEQLLAKNQITANFKGLGGHSGECVKLSVQNTTGNPVYIWVEAGRRLASVDQGLQDIFIVENELLAVQAGAAEEIKINGYCCQATNAGPGEGSEFSVGEMAPRKWVEMANFIDAYDFPESAIQSAVWVMSDSIAVSSICDSDENIHLLKRKVANLLGIEVPWYSIAYEKDESLIFSNRPEQLLGDIDFYVNTHCLMTVLIKDPYGQNIAYPLPEGSLSPGEYTYKLNQRISGWEPGRYSINFIQDRQIPLLKKTFYIK